MTGTRRESTEVEFYYGLGSRYSYLASTQIATWRKRPAAR